MNVVSGSLLGRTLCELSEHCSPLSSLFLWLKTFNMVGNWLGGRKVSGGRGAWLSICASRQLEDKIIDELTRRRGRAQTTKPIKMYLSKSSHVFVQIAKLVGSSLKMHLSKLQQKNKDRINLRLGQIWIATVANWSQVLWFYKDLPWVFFEIISSLLCNKTIAAMGKCLKAAGIKWI